MIIRDVLQLLTPTAHYSEDSSRNLFHQQMEAGIFNDVKQVVIVQGQDQGPPAHLSWEIINKSLRSLVSCSQRFRIFMSRDCGTV